MKERLTGPIPIVSKEEIEDWMKRCPIERFQKVLLEKGVVVRESGLKADRRRDPEGDRGSHPVCQGES